MDMTNATAMTIEQKRGLIMFDPNEAYYVLINQDSYEMYSALKWVATKTISDLDGCCSFTETAVAGKNALLAMLELGLI